MEKFRSSTTNEYTAISSKRKIAKLFLTRYIATHLIDWRATFQKHSYLGPQRLLKKTFFTIKKLWLVAI